MLKFYFRVNDSNFPGPSSSSSSSSAAASSSSRLVPSHPPVLPPSFPPSHARRQPQRSFCSVCHSFVAVDLSDRNNSCPRCALRQSNAHQNHAHNPANNLTSHSSRELIVIDDSDDDEEELRDVDESEFIRTPPSPNNPLDPPRPPLPASTPASNHPNSSNNPSPPGHSQLELECKGCQGILQVCIL